MAQSPEDFLKNLTAGSFNLDELKDEPEPMDLPAFKAMLTEALPKYFKSSPMAILLSDPLSGGVLIGMMMAYIATKTGDRQTLKDVIIKMGGEHVNIDQM